MKYECTNCGYVGYNLASDGSRDNDNVCPNCDSHATNPIRENTPHDKFSDPEGDMESIDNYYDDMGSGMA